jgi:regulator of protease activity HflC (stomatin/prohibitin superfamily)
MNAPDTLAPRQTHAQRPAGAVALVAIVLGIVGLFVVALAGVAVLVLAAIACLGFVIVQPNESSVLILFGRYTGTLTQPGPWWVNPFTRFWRVTVSLRVRNFQSERIKVNDGSGNPIEIAAVVVWRVTDTARAIFDVEDFEQFVVVQSETAVRHLASMYPYDDYDAAGVSLRGSAGEVLDSLHAELQSRLETAGIDVLETRLTHLAYAAEIAEVMLRRQQAEAIIAARQKIVQGAVSMVEMALGELSAKQVVALDDERRAAMVSNLMTVLCAESEVQPVINTGTLYNG